MYGSDHCPVYIDLHDSITQEDGTILHLRDLLDPPNRPPSTAPMYPTDPPRLALEPPRFATKFYDEFSGRQKTLKSFFSGTTNGTKKSVPSESPDHETPPPVAEPNETKPAIKPASPPPPPVTTPFGIARAAFNSIESQPGPSRYSHIDMIKEKDEPRPPVKKRKSGQAKLSSFFNPPPSKDKSRSISPDRVAPQPSQSSTNGTHHFPSTSLHASTNGTLPSLSPSLDPDEDALIAQAIAEADEVQATQRAEKNAQAAPIWANVFAKKLPPLCNVHHKPCKDYSERDSERSISSAAYFAQSSRSPDRTRARGSGFVLCRSCGATWEEVLIQTQTGWSGI